MDGNVITMLLAQWLRCFLIMALGLTLLQPVPTIADQAQYIYDDLGRLSQVIDGQGNVATYTYDAVGNLLSITRNTGGVGAPTITAFTPNTGNAGASVNVSLTGTNLTGASLATSNPGILVRNVVTTPTAITATFQIAFSAASGAATVTVTTTTGSATTSFSVNASAPVLSTLSPTSGPVTRMVTITGNGFSTTAGLNQIKFNGLTATTLSATATTLTTQVPSGATTGPVTVTVGGLTSNGVNFTVAAAGPPPTLTTVSPNVGSVQGGQQTTLTGTNFVAGTTVKIGNKLASVLTLVSATTMIVQVPASVPGPADVVVTNLNGDAVAQNGYTYLSGAPQKIGFITPTMGLINISRNVPVTVSFSRPVDRTSITTSTFAFTQGATPVAGTFIFEFGDTVVTFRATATLAASTAYTLSLTQGIKSVDGVPLDGPFIGSFTTGTGSDTVSPTITMTPIHGATNVPFNTSIVLTFSEPINPNTVNAATVLVMSQGEVRAGTITFGQQNTFAVFTPASPFFPTASATVTVLGQVTDTAGNLLQGTGGVGTSVVSTFTTSSVADRLPPVVLQLLPINTATGISTRTTITATFSESVNPNTITPTTFQVTSGGTPIAGAYSFSNLNQTVTFIPTAPLPPVATVNISISQISDVVGNVMVLPFTSSFQTQSAIDNIRPFVVRPSPSTFTFQSNPPTNTNVPLNFKPMIAFDERINPSTVTSTTFSMSANFATIPATVAVAPDGLSAVLTPNQPLVPNTIYSVSWTSGIHDLVGNQLFNPSTVNVTTGPVATDLVLPTVTNVSPAPGTQGAPINTVVVVQFSEPVSFTSITPQTVILSTGGVPVATQFTMEQNNTVLRIVPANLLPLQANKFYELTVTPGVLDLAGNPLGAPFTSSLTTGGVTDATVPTVTTFTPALFATGVSRQATVSVTFSEPINPITVTSSTFWLAGSGQNIMVGTYHVSTDRKTVTFTPAHPFFANNGQSINVNGVEDLAGNRASGSSVFTTAVAPGTNIAALPTVGAATTNPLTLFADGQTTTTVAITNVSGGSPLTLVPNGTTIGVMTIPNNFHGGTVSGGTILGGVTSPSDPRVQLFTTLGGNITAAYQAPNLPNLSSFAVGAITLVSVDAAGAPVEVFGSGSVQLSRSSTFVPTRNPSALLANGSSTGQVTLVVRDQFGTPIPAGHQVAVTTEPVYSQSSIGGGTITGGTAAADPRFRLFTTTTGGRIEFTYTAPTLAANQSGSAIVQAAGVDEAGNFTRPIASTDNSNDRFTLSGSSGFTGPQPTLLAISPAHTQSGVGTNAVVEALLSHTLNVSTVSLTPIAGGAATFTVMNGTVAVPGTLSFHASERGPNTLVRFTPTAPFVESGTFTVAITVGVKNTSGIPLLSAGTATFSTGTVSDTTPPTVAQVMPPNASTDVATNRLVTVQFSEPINATTLNETTFTVSSGGSPLSGRVSLGSGPNGPNTLATFTSNQLLSATTGYEVSLSSAILDTARNPLASFGSSFTSGSSIDNFQPSVVSTSPALIRGDNLFLAQTNVPLGAKITVQFSEPMNPLTLTTNTVQVTHSATDFGPLSVAVPGTLTMASDLRSVTFTPSQPLIPNAVHSVTLSSTIQDLAGNALLPYIHTSFVTGVQTADATAPTIVRVNPPDGTTGVPINGPITVQFSEPIAPTTVNGSTFVVGGASGPILGTFSFEQNNTVVRWKPANLFQFAPSTAHTVTISSGVTDLSGNPMTTTFSSSFTAGSGTDTVPPSITSAVPANGTSGVSRLTTLQLNFSEPINPATLVLGSTFKLNGPGTFTNGLPGTIAFSADHRQLTFTPSHPLSANQSYNYTIQGLEDIAGNKAGSGTVVGAFTTALAPGTVLALQPVTATGTANPSTLFADGLQSTTALVTNIALPNGSLAPNGTSVAVTADPVFNGLVVGGVILGGTPSAADPRFKLFTTIGGTISFTYVAPNRPDLASGQSSLIAVASVDAAGAPIAQVGQVNLQLIRGDAVTMSSNPGTLRANGTSFADVTLTLLKSSSSTPSPASTRLAVTADPVFVPSAGGTITGGTASNDPRFRIFTALPGGEINVTYTAPVLASGQADAVIQTAAVDEAGTILRQIPNQMLPRAGHITLSATTGSLAPQPVVVALSPANTQTGVGRNAVIMAKFSQPLNPSTVTASSFTVTSGVTLTGARTLSASERGPNTVVTFTPSAPLPATSSVTVAITSGIQNTFGEPLLLNSLSTANFSTEAGSDTVAPSVLQVNPPNGVMAVGTNNVITAEFSEPINATTLTTMTFTVSAGGVPVNGRVKVLSGPRGPNTQAVFIPDQFLGGTITYTIGITAGITDTAGNPLAAPFASSFDTGSGIDNFQPSVVSVSPRQGETGVPLNTKVTVRFSEPINPLTIHSGTFSVGGAPFSTLGMPGTITIAPDLLSATFTPAQLLLPNTSYGVNVASNANAAAIQDLAGNVLLPPTAPVIVGGFTTGSGPADTTPPHVTLVSPVAGATAVPTNGQVLIKFSEPLAGPSVNPQTVTVTAGGVPITGTMSLEQNNTVIRWKVANLFQFAPNVAHTFTVTTGVTDTVGNPMAAPFTSTFMTGTGSDTAAPTVVSVTPVSGATNVSRTTSVSVTFSEEINPATILYGTPFVPGNTINIGIGFAATPTVTLTVSPDRKSLTLVPTDPLLAGQGASISINGIEDRAGNKISFTSSFTTAMAPGTNTTALPTSAVISTNPRQLFADGQTSTAVTITTVARNGVLVPNGTMIAVTADPIFVANSAGGSILGGVPSAADARIRLFTTLNGAVTLTYQSPNRPDLFNGGSAGIQVLTVDAAGAPIDRIAFDSVTLVRGSSGSIDVNPAQLLANGASVADVAINLADNVGGQVVPVPSGVTYAVTVDPVFTTTSVGGVLTGGTVAPDNRFRLMATIPGGLINLSYTAPVLSSGQSATSLVQVAKVDSAGNILSQVNPAALTGGFISLNGSTGSTSPQPTVLVLSPANGQVNVGTTTPISAKFSLPVNRSSVVSGPSGTFTVNLTSTGTHIPGTFAFSASDRGSDTIVTFVPGTPLPINASVSVNLTAGIRSVSGQTLRATANSTFSVALTPDSVAPTLVQSNPINGAGAVPTNSFISAEFSEPINGTTVEASTFSVTVGGAPIAGRFTFAEGGRGKNSIVTFIPNQLLAPTTTYEISVANGVKDSAGNGVIPATVTFTTAGTIDNIVPTIITTVPAAGATDFPATGTPITVTFSEPVNPLAINPNTVNFFTNPPLPATLALSFNNTVLTVTPLVPLFAGASTQVRLNGVQDVAGNPLPSTNVGFTTAIAPGTTNLPTAATLVVNPPQLYANGLTTSQVTITVTRNGVLVPNGTRIAVSADPSLSFNSLGGTISGASIGTSVDGRFLVFQTLGGQVVATYTSPDLVAQGFSTSGNASTVVYSVDLDTRPVGQLGIGNVTLTGPSTAQGSANPTSIVANGSTTSTITFNQVKDTNGTVVPNGTTIGVRVASLYNDSFAFFTGGGGGGGGAAIDIGNAWNGTGTLVPAGTILGGTASAADPNVRLLTTTNGQMTATYQSPFANITGGIVIQAVAIDANGLPVRVLGQTSVSLAQ